MPISVLRYAWPGESAQLLSNLPCSNNSIVRIADALGCCPCNRFNRYVFPFIERFHVNLQPATFVFMNLSRVQSRVAPLPARRALLAALHPRNPSNMNPPCWQGLSRGRLTALGRSASTAGGDAADAVERR